MKDYTFGYNFDHMQWVTDDDQTALLRVTNDINALVAANCTGMAATQYIPQIIQYLRNLKAESHARYCADKEWCMSQWDEDDDWIPLDASPELKAEYSERWSAQQVNHSIAWLCGDLIEHYMGVLTKICKSTPLENLQGLSTGNMCKDHPDTIFVAYIDKDYSANGRITPMYYSSIPQRTPVLVYLPSYVSTERIAKDPDRVFCRINEREFGFASIFTDTSEFLSCQHWIDLDRKDDFKIYSIQNCFLGLCLK